LKFILKKVSIVCIETVVCLSLFACGGGAGGGSATGTAAGQAGANPSTTSSGSLDALESKGFSDADWATVADEGQSFTVEGTQTVRYGSGTNWLEKSVTGTAQCSNTFFGNDPIVGVVKQCQKLIVTVPASDWSKVASEGQPFTVSGTQTVRYGAGSSWIEKSISGAAQCTNAFFGSDPIVGVVKECQVRTTTTPPATVTWVKVANEGQSAVLAGMQKVRYGATGYWIEKTLSGTIECSNTFFGQDPIRGTVKTCEAAVAPSNGDYPNLWNYQQINLVNAVANANATPYPSEPNKKIRIAIVDSGYSQHPDINWAKDAAGKVIALTTDDNKSNVDGLTVKNSLHVAGIIGGINYKNLGRVGACPQCEILSIKFAPPMFPTAAQSDDHMAKGIRLAVDNGAKAINISLNAGGFPSYPEGWSCDNTPLTKSAVEYASARNVAIVASAGSYGNDDASQENGARLVKRDVKNISPASCPGVISVGASDQTGSIAQRYSNHGGIQLAWGGSEIGSSRSLTLIAPGGGVSDADGLYGKGLDGVFGATTETCESSYLTNVRGGNATSAVQILSAWGSGSTAGGDTKSCYRYLSGTSMSAAHVSGVIGLMLSVQPNLTPKDIRGILRSTAKNIDATPACSAGGTGYCGSGLLDANEAVKKAKITVPTATSGTGPCSYNNTAETCKLDVMAYDTDLTNAKEETVFAYGKMWKYDAAGQAIQSAVDLRSIPRYANGPCSKAPASQNCVIDTLTILNHPQYGYIEGITAYGAYWNFDKNGVEIEWGKSADLKTVARYGDGGPVFGGSAPRPCGASRNMPCKFDTRELIDARDTWGDIFEGITAYGNYYIFRWDGTFIGSNALTSVSRYVDGPCKYKPAGGYCTFDTSEKKRVNGKIIEVITAYGRYWEFEDGIDTPRPGSDVLLKDIARFK
jgi:subtilisin family serine protease